MISFKTHIDNNEYIIIERFCLPYITVIKDYPENIRDMANKIFSESISFEKNKKLGYTNEIAIQKNSLLGKFLLENGMSKEIRNEDLYISYEDVVNAFNVAAFENNSVFHILSRLFIKREEGSTIELSKKYGSEVIDYISNNKDFQTYLKKQDGTYEPKEYVVYEDGEFFKKILLSNEKQKIK